MMTVQLINQQITEALALAANVQLLADLFGTLGKKVKGFSSFHFLDFEGARSCKSELLHWFVSVFISWQNVLKVTSVSHFIESRSETLWRAWADVKIALASLTSGPDKSPV